MDHKIVIDKDQETIETWAFIEVMGHTTIAGRLSERKFGIQIMMQVDVPNPEEGFQFSRLLSPSAIFSIQPTTEEWCRKFITSRVNYEVLPYIPQERQLNAPTHDYSERNLFDDILEDKEQSYADH